MVVRKVKSRPELHYLFECVLFSGWNNEVKFKAARSP